MNNFDTPTIPAAVTKIKSRSVFQKAHMTIGQAKSALIAQSSWRAFNMAGELLSYNDWYVAHEEREEVVNKRIAYGEMALYTPGPDGAYVERLHIKRGDDLGVALKAAGL